MTSTRGRRIARAVPVLVVLVLAVVFGRQLFGSIQSTGTPAAGAMVAEAPSDHGLVAITSRVPVPVTEARLDLGAAAPVLSSAVLLLLLWTTVLLVSRRWLALDSLDARWRRRGPPAVLAR